ncbi:MAG: major capsid protein [Methyloceanibacter sp.]|nr:major capsid protein [Methyloceanibacter sp.]
MTTRLSDVIVPEVFNRYMMVETKEKSALFQSGILRDDSQASSFLTGGGQTVHMPFWNDLANDTENIGNDDPADDATPNKIVASDGVAIRNNRNQGWAKARLTTELAGEDPMRAIQSRTTAYWTRSFQRHLVASLTGLFADNAANNGGDMRVVIGTDAATAVTPAEQVSAEAIIDLRQTAGDAGDMFTAIMMHSVVKSRLDKLNLIDYIPDSEGRVRYPTYLGYRVIVDDGCPAVSGTNRINYSTYLLGMGAFGFAEVPPEMPVEVDSRPRGGKGQGTEELWTRRQYVMHPYGFSWTSTTMAGQSPTNAEIILPANWTRVYPERKQIPMAELVTNG